MDSKMETPRIPEQSQPNRKENLKTFLTLIQNTHPRQWQLWIGVVLGLIATVTQLAVPKLTQTLINGLKSSFNVQLLVVVAILFLAGTIISAISGMLLGVFGENVVARLRDTLWRKLVRLPVSYFDNVKTGEMTSRLINDSTQIKDLLADTLPQMIMSMLQLVGALAIMLIMDWKMTAAMFISVPLVIIIMLPIMNQTSKIGRQRQDALAGFNGTSGETLSEIRLVKSSNAEQYETATGFTQIDNLYHIGLKEAVYDSIANPIMNAVMLALLVGLLAYASVRVSAGTMALGTMMSFMMYLFQIIDPIESLGRFFTTLSKTNGSTQRVRTLLEEPEETFSKGKAQSVTGQTLAMKHVDFAYMDDHKPVLHDINIEAKPNSVVAFAGPSGSGKSTIFGLLERYYQPTKGQITIGDQVIEDIDLQNWRSQIGYVSQDSAIMTGTIRHNLTYGTDDNYEDADLWHVLKLAYADQFVREFPEGLDTQVGERGVKVSGGQRQRLAIARAFLRDPKILMLDEATASLDSESEAMVQKALGKLMKGRTTLIIAHRLSTIVDADNIYFIENGHVSGHGNHKELMKSLPIYRDYVKIQFKK